MNKLWDIHNNLFKIKNSMYAILKFYHEVRYHEHMLIFHLKYIIENEQTKTMFLLLKYIGEPKSKIFY